MRNTLFLLLVGMLVYGCGYDEQETIRKAELYQSSGKHNAAIIEFKKVLQKNSTSKKVRVLLAKSYLSIGQGESAEKELAVAKKIGVPESDFIELWAESLLLQKKYNRIFDEAPLKNITDPVRAAKLKLMHGYAYLGLNNKDKAQELFTQIKNSNSLPGDIDIALSRVAILNNDFNEANNYIVDATRVDSKNIMAWLLKGQIMLARKDLDSAQEAFEKVVGLSTLSGNVSAEFEARVYLVNIALSQKNLVLAKERVALLAKINPKHPTAKYLSALVEFQLKNYDTARSTLEEIVVLMPNELSTKLLLGATHFAQGHYEQANKYLSNYVENVPTHIYARKMLAAVQIKLGRTDDAFQSLKSVIGKDNKDAELLAMVGQTAMFDNRPEEAVDYLKQASGSNPENIELRTELAKAYLQSGSYDEAIGELKSIKGKGEIQAKTMLVYAHMQKHDVKAARELAKQLIKESPDQAQPYTVAGTVELLAGAREEAKAYFNKSLTYKPDYLPALVTLARVSFEDGSIGQATDYYNKVLQLDSKNEKAIVGLAIMDDQNGSLDKAISRLEQAIEKTPGALMPGIILGRYYMKRNEPEKAFITVSGIAKLHQDKPNVQLILVQALLATGKNQSALEAAESIVKKWPKLPIALMELARVQVALKKYDMAELTLDRVLKIKPDFPQAKTALFSVYMLLGKVSKAEIIASDLKRKYPKSSLGNVLSGDVYMAKKQYDLAQKEYKTALKIHPERTIISKLSIANEVSGKIDSAAKLLQEWLMENQDDDQSRMHLAVLYTRLKDSKGAKTQYQRLLEKNPNNVAVLNNLALLLLDSEPETATSYAEKAYRLQPGIAAISDTYGWILYKTGQIAKAIPLLADAANKSNNPSIQYHYAAALIKAANISKAKEILQKVAKMEFDESAEAVRLLNNLKNQ